MIQTFSPNLALVQRALRSHHLPTVRRRIFRQLLESLLYEGVLKARSEADGRSAVDGVDAQGRPVRYVFTLGDPAYGFARTRIVRDPLLRVSESGESEAASLTGFLTEIREHLGGVTDERIEGFSRELEETLVKDAIAQCAREERDGRLAEADYDVLEGMVMDGHPYHPAYKSRVGFDLEDHLAFGPEFAQPVRPLWIAAHRSLTTAAASSTLDGAYLRGQLGPAWDAFRRELDQAVLRPEEYELLPVHPWQWREAIAVPFAAHIRDRKIVALGTDPHAHLAQQSIRTMACQEAPHRDYMKLSLSILNTSTSRGLAPHTVTNAPAVSDWLRGIVASDPYLRDDLRVILLGEVRGVAVAPEPVSELVRERTYGRLGCIWRETLDGRLDPSERAVPYTGLIARELDGTPLIDPWVRRWGIREWVKQLLEVSVTPLVHFLQGHGIAIESHAQNMALVHDQGRPTRVVLRDFHDGVRFSRAHLADPATAPELASTPSYHANRNSFVETDDLDLVADFFLDAFFFINLGELAMFLDDVYDYAEEEFWSEVRTTVAAYQAKFPELADRFALFDVSKPQLDVEQLTARRLLPDTELRLHSVPNPLHGPRAVREV
ncbi:IucA/IucC family protein [Streptomyces acidicola]|uniref:IucA/IucC family protein n=1 Tax=Streptomyces acidicola TaxID=2596892 RepID=UPI0034154043